MYCEHASSSSYSLTFHEMLQEAVGSIKFSRRCLSCFRVLPSLQQSWKWTMAPERPCSSTKKRGCADPCLSQGAQAFPLDMHTSSISYPESFTILDPCRSVSIGLGFGRFGSGFLLNNSCGRGGVKQLTSAFKLWWPKADNVRQRL